jgi:hypothetical protein
VKSISSTIGETRFEGKSLAPHSAGTNPSPETAQLRQGFYLDMREKTTGERSPKGLYNLFVFHYLGPIL